MKAKDYIEKYRERLESGDIAAIKKAGADMLMEFSKEVAQIAETRGVQRNSALVALLKEQNKKWNAVVKVFPTILARDGFMRFWINRMPELQRMWEIKR